MKLIVNGGSRAFGEIEIYGAKNAILPLLSSACLTTGEVTFSNIPIIDDALEKIEIMEKMGCQISFHDSRSMSVCTKNINPSMPKASRIRTSILFAGVFLGRFGYCQIAYPKGDKIGSRSVNFHIDALEKMGAKFTFHEEFMIGNTEELHGIEYTFPVISVGATQNIMLAACLAKGITILNNAAIEPEIVELSYFLAKLGYNIEGIGQSRIVIHGRNLSNKSINFALISDRLQVFSYMIAAMITNGKIKINGNRMMNQLGAGCQYLLQMGAKITFGKNYVECDGTGEFLLDKYKVLTKTFPGFATDLHPLLVPLLCTRSKKSKLYENLFDGRFSYIKELSKMGANINQIDKHTIVIRHIDQFSNHQNLIAHDIRGGAAVLLAAISAQGKSKITNFYQISRGYDNLIYNFNAIGIGLDIENHDDMHSDFFYK